ncbi:MAG: hypothetical protein KZQ83_03315 [gamma proteobacterium symbiont of Taylorina sp.]|nr:hypothetical protein [gamma proteobacterium symbiont of Taylorina sp.]
MTIKEKKLLGIFLAILVIGVVAQGIPFAYKIYQSGIDEVEQLKQKRSRLKKLMARQNYWRTEFEKNNKQKQQLLKKLFVGKSPELIAARVQGKLKTLAKKSGIKVDSMSLPDLKQSEDWLLVTQTMSFKAHSDKFMKVLNLIKKSNPSLVVIDVQVRTYRKMLNCTLKVVGFSHFSADQGSDTQ